MHKQKSSGPTCALQVCIRASVQYVVLYSPTLLLSGQGSVVRVLVFWGWWLYRAMSIINLACVLSWILRTTSLCDMDLGRFAPIFITKQGKDTEVAMFSWAAWYSSCLPCLNCASCSRHDQLSTLLIMCGTVHDRVLRYLYKSPAMNFILKSFSGFCLLSIYCPEER